MSSGDLFFINPKMYLIVLMCAQKLSSNKYWPIKLCIPGVHVYVHEIVAVPAAAAAATRDMLRG